MAKIENMFGEQFAEFIKEVIPSARPASGGTELVCRCRYCADSSDPTHGHMYIKIPQSKNDIPMFHCFKCQTSGIIDSRTLLEWGIYDPIMGVQLDKIIKSASKNQANIGYNRTWYSFINHINNYALAQYKLNYINNRIGTNLTFQDCLSQKIILNLRDTLIYNKIDQYTRHQNIIDQLNEYFVGFLSLDNNFVNLRRMCDEGIVYKSIDNRYINYNIHDKKDNTEKMYIMPTTIDLANPNRVNIHLAEGPFDILSIRYNLRQNEIENSIFAAITGSGYKGLVMHLISTFKLFYFNLHLYPDNDKHGNNSMVNEIKELIKPYGAILFEHRNLYPGEKDFGVPKNRIIEKIY